VVIKKIHGSNISQKSIKWNVLWSVVPLKEERCNYNKMVEHVSFRKLKG
jgi:hypothetical protein